MDERFADHTAEMIVAVATAAHPDDPEAAAGLALRAVDWVPEPGKAIICPWHGFQRGIACGVCYEEKAAPDGDEDIAGPDYPPELEAADEARDELAEQEAECDAVPD